MRGLIFQATVQTVLFGLTVALISGVLGGGFAWLLSRTQIPGRRLFIEALSLPYALPSYVLGMAWVVLGNPRVGLLKSWLPGQGAYGFWGMVGVESTVALAFPFLETLVGFSKLDSSLEEAARVSGASAGKVFFSISAPLLWSVWLNGVAMSFLYAISCFGVPAILGLPVRQYVLTTLIYSEFKLGGLEGLYLGFRIAVLLVVMAGLILFYIARLKRAERLKGIALTGGKASKSSLVEIGKWKVFVLGFLGIWVIMSLVLPWVALALSALAPVAGDFSPRTWTLIHLRDVFHLVELKEALINSMRLTLAVTGTLTLLSFLAGYLSVRRNSRAVHHFIALTGFLYSLPGSVLAIVIILLSAWLGLMEWTLTWIGIAYAIKYGALSFRMIEGAFEQVHPSLEEASQLCGAHTFRRLIDLWWPLLKPSLTAAALLCALPIFSELTMSVLLTGPDGATLGTVLFQLQEYSDQPSAAALGWIMMTVALGLASLRILVKSGEIR